MVFPTSAVLLSHKKPLNLFGEQTTGSIEQDYKIRKYDENLLSVTTIL